VNAHPTEISAKAILEENSFWMGERTSLATQPVYASFDLWGNGRHVLAAGLYLLHRSHDRTGRVRAVPAIGWWRRGGLRLLQDSISHAIGLLLISITRLTDGKFGLNRRCGGAAAFAFPFGKGGSHTLHVTVPPRLGYALDRCLTLGVRHTLQDCHLLVD
jgi:hypothetical protein